MSANLFAARGRCEFCGGLAVVGSTCPRGVICPVCRAAPGNPCRRPSGHRSDVLHAARVELAESFDACAAPAPSRQGILTSEDVDGMILGVMDAHLTSDPARSKRGTLGCPCAECETRRGLENGEPLDERRRRLPLSAPLPHGEGRRLV